MKIDGHCHCGEITFQAEVDPDALNICHCTDCQTLSGTAFRVNIPAPAEHFVLLSGTPKTYIKTAESGNKRLHAFCGNCGTPIYACAVDNPQSYGLRIGTITQRAAFSPKRQGSRHNHRPGTRKAGGPVTERSPQVRFARDSALEGGGFELVVPL